MLTSQHRKRLARCAGLSLCRPGFEPERREARAKSSSAACGGCSENFLALRSARPRRLRPPMAAPGTARGPAKQVQIPPSPPRRRKRCIACGGFFMPPRAHAAAAPFPQKFCCANFLGVPFRARTMCGPFALSAGIWTRAPVHLPARIPGPCLKNRVFLVIFLREAYTHIR